ISSGMNNTIAADPGKPNASADGTGHGYELGFIPVTDGSSDPSVSTSSNVALSGTVTAGAYHTLAITIANDGSADGGFFSTSSSEAPGGIPVQWTFVKDFNPVGYINTHFNQDDAMFALMAVSSTPVAAFQFPDLF